ncbi:MAG TPA: cytochrome c oxidase accessory protein CcoG [Gemmataceae bacterium]|nr:cytochrome c oxidase accessory protein CcoG [Gemmataceae bacterium]
MDVLVHDDDEIRSVRQRKSGLPLYVTRLKVYPRAVRGRWRTVKWAALACMLAIYYLVPWLRWNRGPGAPSQAILLDLDGRRGWIFDIVIWPQEVYFVTGFLILGAVGLFLATSLFGRVWCGFACPQTVWTDLFMLVERLIEGDRNERMRLDKARMSATKLMRKSAKHAAWLIMAAATGGAWVFYYVDAPSSFVKIFRGEASLEVYSCIGLLTATTYVLAGWAREQVCTYMCPWPRFQAAMFDEQTLIVTYQKWRGELRGKHKAGDSWEGRGDCVDCRLCVAVCPTGIDIRDGQQIECIGCGLCVDACTHTMDKVGRPHGLIRWDTLARQEAREARAPLPAWRAARPRTLLYGLLVSIVAAVMLIAFALRSDTELTVQRDRSPNFVRLSNGDIRNSYVVKILNKSQDARRFRFVTRGLPEAILGTVGDDTEITVHPNAVGMFRVFLTVPGASAPIGSTPITWSVEDDLGRERATHVSIFVGPGR